MTFSDRVTHLSYSKPLLIQYLRKRS